METSNAAVNDSSDDATGAETPEDVTDASTPAIAHEDELEPAIAAPSTEKDTHVLVPNTHVSFLRRLVDDLERGLAGADLELVSAFRRVFGRAD